MTIAVYCDVKHQNKQTKSIWHRQALQSFCRDIQICPSGHYLALPGPAEFLQRYTNLSLWPLLSLRPLFGITRPCSMMQNSDLRDRFVTHAGFFFLHTFGCQGLNKYSDTLTIPCIYVCHFKICCFVISYTTSAKMWTFGEN